MVAAFIQNCTAGTARKCIQREAVWKIADTAEKFDHGGNTCGQGVQCETVQLAQWSSTIKYFLHHRWNHGEPEHLKTTERFFLGFVSGQGETLRRSSAPAQRSLALRLWFRWTQRQRPSLSSSPLKGFCHFLACEAPRLVGAQTATVPTYNNKFRLRDLRMSRRWLVRTQL